MKDQEEDHALLEEFELSDTTERRTSKLQTKAKHFLQWTRDQGDCRWWQWRRVLVGGCLVIILAAFFIVTYSPGVQQSIFQYNGGPLAIALSPDSHVNRGATTLNFDWDITAGSRAPDGVEKRVYLVNDEFPGPTIEARSGDRITVHVRNSLDDEGVSLHWHGLQMKGYNNMDGAVGFTQCPIPAGGEMTYNFTIGDQEHGTFWWHGHDGVQRADGLFGGLVVHAPNDGRKDEADNDALLMVGDWFHQRQTDVLAWYADAASLGREPVPDSLLINGRGRYNCSMAVPSSPVVCTPVKLEDRGPLLASPKGNTRLRVVNTGTIAGLSLQIDGATVRAVRVDGGFPVHAEVQDTIGILYPGERVDFIVEWKVEASLTDPWLTVHLDDENFGLHNPALNPIHSYPLFASGIPTNETVRTKLPLVPGNNTLDLQKVTSATRISPAIPPKAQETMLLYLKTAKLSSLNNEPVGFVNHTSWAPQSPPLLAQDRSSWDTHQLVHFIGLTGSEPTRVDIILNNLDDGSHPLHLHGNSFYVLSSYKTEGRNSWGSYNPYDGSEPPNGLNLISPVLKDTVSVPRRGHVVLTVLADNPGIWMLHCHMLVHMARGMGMGIHVGESNDSENIAAKDTSAGLMCA